ncbi:MAG: hypothetical protein CMO80_18905 [Verrucomicrobiales bacterium]|nr:hypothetical protein [Verrucomicrobiales bacterium]|tara:strand:- start:685 stop:888 length:204 start_codon:yes stop_codon:yes gene_type:complete
MGYSVRTDRYRYTEWWRTKTTDQLNGSFIDRDVKPFNTPEFIEFYDYQADPDEAVNLANDSNYASVQ